MAFGLKHWILVVGLLCAGVTALSLPLRSGYARLLTPERRRVMELEAEIRGQREMLRETQWADSVGVLVREARRAGTSFIVELPSDVSPARVDTIRKAVAATVGRESTGAVIGILAVAERLNATPFATGPAYYAGSQPAPHCVALVWYSTGELPRNLMMALAGGTTALGPCRFYAHYGMPGPGISRWLGDRDGYELALAPVMRVSSPMPPAAYLGPFGSILHRWTWPGSSDQRCLAGDVGRCRSVFIGVPDTPSLGWDLAPWLTRNGPASYVVQDFTATAPFSGLNRTMLADLEAEFGATRFARFWRSDADVASAFQTAFGEPVGKWVMQWGRQRFQPMDTGSLAAPGHLAETLLTLVLAMLLAMAVARRRTVGRT